MDRTGGILHYNAAEGDVSGRDPAEMVGKNFFEDVAQCFDTREFKGRFRKGVESGGEFDIRLNYTFDYRMTPTQVRTQRSAKREEYRDTRFIFAKRLPVPSEGNSSKRRPGRRKWPVCNPPALHRGACTSRQVQR